MFKIMKIDKKKFILPIINKNSFKIKYQSRDHIIKIKNTNFLIEHKYKLLIFVWISINMVNIFKTE